MLKKFCDECGGEVKASDASGMLRAQTKSGIIVMMSSIIKGKDICYNCALNALVVGTPVTLPVQVVAQRGVPFTRPGVVSPTANIAKAPAASAEPIVVAPVIAAK